MTTATLPSNSHVDSPTLSFDDILTTAQTLRWEIGQDYHERLMEAIYTDASNIADRAVTRPGEKPRFDMDRTIDRIVTSRRWGFPLMILLIVVLPMLSPRAAIVPQLIGPPVEWILGLGTRFLSLFG